jgi:hypothetical protein
LEKHFENQKRRADLTNVSGAVCMNFIVLCKIIDIEKEL